MENASKALLIAAAILLVILIISLGIYIYNQAQDTVNNNGMDQTEIQAFNNKFSKYESTGTTTGTQVRSLIQEMVASNASNPSHEVTMDLTYKKSNGTSVKDSSTDPSSNNINSRAKYSVELKYGNGGYVNQIIIKEQ